MSDTEGVKVAQQSWVIIMTAIIAMAAPATAAVHGWFSKAKEIEIARREQDFKIRTGLVDRAVDPKLSTTERERLFRFLAASADDPILQAWATHELAAIDRETAKLHALLDTAEKALGDADSRTADLRRRLALSQAANRGGEEAKAQLADATRAYESANAEIRSIKAALGDVTPERLERIRVATAALDDPSLLSLMQIATQLNAGTRADLLQVLKLSKTGSLDQFMTILRRLDDRSLADRNRLSVTGAAKVAPPLR